MTSSTRLAAIVALVFSSTGGCTSGSTHATGAGPLVFVGEDLDPSARGATVFLRAHPAIVPNPNRVEVEVVARGAGDLHGAALRVTWDPAALAFVSAEHGEAWSKTSLAVAKEGAPGQLAIAWTENGEVSIDASRDVVLGTLLFEARGRNGTKIAFKTERSAVVDKMGGAVRVSWHGGAVAKF